VKTLTVASIVNLVWLQVHHTECPPLFAVRLPWCSVSLGFLSNRWYLLCWVGY